MAAYNCTLFLNTGFNTINIPDSPALVNGMTSISVPALDINQERFLPYVRVRATWDQIKNADYCKVGDFYYTINSINMTSQDVAEISLTPDFITSAGGPAALEILDGLTDRVHVSNDAYGIYSGDDPYMAPAYDLDVMSDTTSGDFSSADDGYTFIDTTLDLYVMGSKADNDTVAALTAVDNNATEPKEVVFPIVDYINMGQYTFFRSGLSSQQTLQTTKGQVTICMDSSASNFDNITKGIALARALGIESSISGSYQIPSGMIEAPSYRSGHSSYCLSITGKYGTKASTIPFEYGASVQNKRVYYGNWTPYTLASASGSSISANAEEVYDGFNAPHIKYTCDPRREGKPYFRFGKMHGVDVADNPKDFFRGCVPGLPWRSVPMVFTDKSGSIIDAVRHNASVARRDLADVYEQTSYDWNRGLNMLGIGAKTIGAGMSGWAAGGGFSQYNMAGASGINPMAGAKAGGSAFGGSLQNIGNFELAHMQYQEASALERQIEAKEFQIQQNVNVPTIMFPNSPELMGELIGNGYMLYRSVYKAADISRIDKILTAFGYKHTKVLEASDFSNRQKFNYVSGSITVGGNLPRWWCNGISAQIAGGVRVWHIKPTHTAYSSNPIA